MLSFSDTSDPTDVVIIEELESETEIQKPGEMPSALGFNVRLVHGESPIHLKLKKNDIRYEQQQVASIRQNARGELYLEKENLPTIQVKVLKISFFFQNTGIFIYYIIIGKVLEYILCHK